MSTPATATIAVDHLQRLLAAANWCSDEYDEIPSDAEMRNWRQQGVIDDLIEARVIDTTADGDYLAESLHQAILAGQDAIRAANGGNAEPDDSPEAIIEREGM